MTINHNFPNLLYVGKAGQKKILQVGIVADLSATQSMRKKKTSRFYSSAITKMTYKTDLKTDYP